MDHDKIIVIDLGSQTNRLISRRIRDLGVYSDLYPHTAEAEEIMRLRRVKGIVLSGGPNSVYEEDALTIDPAIFDLDIPILGICYGMQLMIHHAGGDVEKAFGGEYGSSLIHRPRNSPLFAGLDDTEQVWMPPGDHLKRLPKDFTVIAKTPSDTIAAIQNGNKKLFGVQFHPEVRHTKKGDTILKNFVFSICQADADWTMENHLETQIDAIRKAVGEENVILGLSGGVDSSVTAVLLKRAIKDRLTCIFVDHGLLREGEVEQVVETFQKHFHMDIQKIDAREIFLNALRGVEDPEQKRKAIGRTFIDLFQKEARSIENVGYLAQGTLYTDTIESGGGTSETIKSHHNVGGLPETMALKLIEPLNKLFKNEVRRLGKTLGLPEELIQRQPFPGPGLAIRIIGEVTEERLNLAKRSDSILREVFAEEGLDQEVWQYFTVLTPLKTVGVMGARRTYEHVLAVRAVTSLDGMTAAWARVPHDVLDTISKRIVNEIPGINRVVYDITSKPPGTIEWE